MKNNKKRSFPRLLISRKWRISERKIRILSVVAQNAKSPTNPKIECKNWEAFIGVFFNFIFLVWPWDQWPSWPRDKVYFWNASELYHPAYASQISNTQLTLATRLGALGFSLSLTPFFFFFLKSIKISCCEFMYRNVYHLDVANFPSTLSYWATYMSSSFHLGSWSIIERGTTLRR